MNWWTEYRNDLIRVECQWCESTEDLYNLDGEILCESCLKAEQVEESDSQLTLLERNS